MQAFYRNRKNMAEATRLKAARCTPALRACLGRHVSRLAQARKEIIREKVYQRGDTSRPLSGRLLSSEQIRFKGPRGEISNRAPYAQLRNDARGNSRLYGHDLELHFAEGAIEETRKQNTADASATVRAILKS